MCVQWYCEWQQKMSEQGQCDQHIFQRRNFCIQNRKLLIVAVVLSHSTVCIAHVGVDLCPTVAPASNGLTRLPTRHPPVVLKECVQIDKRGCKTFDILCFKMLHGTPQNKISNQRKKIFTNHGAAQSPTVQFHF